MAYLVALLLGIGLPLAWWAWNDSRRKNPAVRWPQLAAQLELQFLPDPPRLEGAWKGRAFRVLAEGERASVVTGLRGKSRLRVEIGPKDAVEKAAGMVVPDRIQVGDLAFERRYVVRATPPELGEIAADPSMRQRLMRLPDVHVIALQDRVVVRVPYPSEAGQARDYLDIAAAVADSLE
ncbi:MAG: hypothetical protein KGL53_12325 [Elusimicrobia bacterium]|nr:hypothetical protein [Elusimicrobiota bacterium]